MVRLVHDINALEHIGSTLRAIRSGLTGFDARVNSVTDSDTGSASITRELAAFRRAGRDGYERVISTLDHLAAGVTVAVQAYRTQERELVRRAEQGGDGVPAVPAAPTPGARPPAAPGQQRSTNPGFEGQCTWGAAEMWRRHTGQHPNVSGNAHQWDEAAVALTPPLTVTDQPAENSVVVFPPSVRYGEVGHVAWVRGVRTENGKTYLDITEMNFNVPELGSKAVGDGL